MQQSKTSQLFEEPLFSQLRYDLPLHDLINYKQQTSETLQLNIENKSKLKNVIVLAAVENPEELKDHHWIEYLTDMTQLSQDQIEELMVTNLEERYKEREFQLIQGYFQPSLQELSKHISAQVTQKGKGNKHLVHYVGRHQLLQSDDAIVLSQDEQNKFPIAISIIEVAKLFAEQTIYIFDCNYAGLLVQALENGKQFDALAFAACKSNQQLPYMQQNKLLTVPTDIFTLTMMNPLLGLFIGYVHRSKQHVKYKTFQQVFNLYTEKIEQNQNTYQELNLTLKQITETIAWQSVPDKQYYLLCKHDKQLANIINNYFACERVMSIFGCTCCSTLDLQDQSMNYLWSQLDQFFTQIIQDDGQIGHYYKILKSQNMMSQHQEFMDKRATQSSLDLGEDVHNIFSVYNLTELAAHEDYHLGNTLTEDEEPIFQFSRDQIRSFELQLTNPRLIAPQNIPVIVFQISNTKNMAICVKLLLQLVDRDPDQCKTLGEIGLTVQLYKYIYLNRIDFSSHQKVNEPSVVEEISMIFQLLNKMYSYDVSNIQHYKIVRGANQITDKEFLTKILVNVIVNNKGNENNIKVTCLFHFMLITSPAAQDIYAKYLTGGKDQTNIIHQMINYSIKHQNIVQLLTNISKLSNNNLLILISIQALGNILPYYIQHTVQQRQMNSMSSGAQMRRSVRLSNQQQDSGQNIHIQLLKSYNDESHFQLIQNEIKYVLKQIQESAQKHGVEIRMSLIYCIQQLIPMAVKCQGLYKYDENMFEKREPQLSSQQTIHSITNLLAGNFTQPNQKSRQDAVEIVQENLCSNPFDPMILEQFIEIFQNEINIQVRYELFVIIQKIVILYYQDVINTLKQQMLDYYKEILDRRQYTQLFYKLKFEINEKSFKNGSLLLRMVNLARYDNNAIINSFADRLFKNINADAFVQILMKMRFDKTQLTQHQDILQQFMSEEEKQQLQPNTDLFNTNELIQLITVFQEIETQITPEIENKIYDILQNKSTFNDSQENIQALTESLNSSFNTGPCANLPDSSEMTIDYSINETNGMGSRDSVTQRLESKVQSSLLLPTFGSSMNNLLQYGSSSTIGQNPNDMINDLEIVDTKDFKFNSSFQQYRYKYVIYLFKILIEAHRDITLLKDHQHYASNLHIHNSVQSTVINMMFNAYLHQHQEQNTHQLAQKQAQLTHCKVNGCYYHNMVRINDPGASCGAHMDGIYCINCDKASQQAAHLAQRFLHVNPSSSCNSMAYDKKIDVFTRYREYDSFSNPGQLDTLAQLIKRIIPKSKRSDTLQKYIDAMEQTLQSPQPTENDSTNMEQQYIIRYGYDDDSKPKYGIDSLSYLILMEGGGNIIMTHQQLDELIQRFILKNFVRAMSQTDFCQQMMCGFPVHDNSHIILNDVVLHLAQNPTQEQINFSMTTRNNYKTLNPIGIYKQQQFVGQYIENLFNDGELQRVFGQSLNSQNMLQEMQNIYQSNAMKRHSKIFGTYEVQSVFQQLNQQCQFCKNMSVRKPLIQLIREPNSTLLYEPSKEYDPFIPALFNDCTGEQCPNDFYNKANVNYTEEQYDTFNEKVEQLIKNLASPIPLLDQKLTCGSSECKFLPRSIYRLCHKNEDLLSKFNKSTSELDTEELYNYLTQYKDSQQNTEKTFQSLDIDNIDNINNSFGHETTNNLTTCLSRSFDKIQQNMSAQIYLQEQLAYLEYMHDKCTTPPVYSEKELKLLDSFHLPYNIKTMRIHPVFPIIAIVGDNSQLSIYNIEKRCNMNNITPSIFQPSIYQFLDLKHYHTQPEENQMKMFSKVFDTISLYNNRKYNISDEDPQNSIENGYYANLVENEITGTECQLCQGIYQANKFYTKFNWLPDYDLYNKSCSNAYQQYSNQTDSSETYLDFFTQDLKFSEFDNQIHHRYIHSKLYNKNDASIKSTDILQDQLNGNYIQFLNKTNNYPLVGVSYQHNIDGSCYYQLFNNIYEPGCSRLVSSFKLFEREREFPVELINPLQGMWALDSYRRVLNYNYQCNTSNNFEWFRKVQTQQTYLENGIRHILYDLKGFDLNIHTHKQAMIRGSKFISNLDSDKHIQTKIIFSRGKEIKLVDLYQERMIMHKKAEAFDAEHLEAVNSMCLNNNLLSICDVVGNAKVYDLRSNQEIIHHKFDIPVAKVFVESSNVINCVLQNGSIIRKLDHETLVTVPHPQIDSQTPVSGFVKKNIGGYAVGSQGIVNIYDINTLIKTQIPLKCKNIHIDPFDSIEFRQDGMMFCVWKDGQIRLYDANQ